MNYSPWIKIKVKKNKIFITLKTDYGSHSEWYEIVLKYDKDEKTFTLIDQQPE